MSNFKVGDTILVRATAGRTEGDRIQIWFSGPVALFIPTSECLPAEPSAVSCDTPTASEMNAKTKQCIIDYCMDKINARAEIGYSDWWTRESHIVNSKHIVAVLEHFKDKGYETELASDDVTISW